MHCWCVLKNPCSKPSAPHLAFASARLMALRRLVAGLDGPPSTKDLPTSDIHGLLEAHSRRIMGATQSSIAALNSDITTSSWLRARSIAIGSGPIFHTGSAHNSEQGRTGGPPDSAT